jgi:tRNA dimethylallyltransferase
LPAMNSIGYKQIGLMLRGEFSREEAIRKIKTDSHRFVRHQYAWFHLDDRRIHWFDIQSEMEPEIFSLISNFIEHVQ